MSPVAFTAGAMMMKREEEAGTTVLPNNGVGQAPRVLRGRQRPSSGELEELLRRFQGDVLSVARALRRAPPLVYRWCQVFKLDPGRFEHRQ
jgi:hypothetical protein